MMITPELLDFLRTQHALGTPRADLEQMLLTEGGWEKTDIDEAFRSLGIDTPKIEPPAMPVELAAAPPVVEVREVEVKKEALTQPEIITALPREEEAKPVITLAPAQDDFLGIFVDAPVVEKEEDIVESPPVEASVVAPPPQEAVTPEPPPERQPIHFDLSQLKKTAPPAVVTPIATMPERYLSEPEPEPKAPDTVAPAAPPANPPKTLQTKSIAELWLEKKEEPAPSSSKIFGKRTMSSDILLRGSGSTIKGMPAISVPDEPVYEGAQNTGGAHTPVVVSHATQEVTASAIPESVQQLPPPAPFLPNKNEVSPVAVDLMRAQKNKQILAITLGILGTLLLVGAGVFAVMLLRGPNTTSAFAIAATKFLAATSFIYKGTTSVDLVLTTATDGVTRNGSAKFTLDYQGQLKSGSDGYGDGTHRVKLAGGLQSGDFSWATNVESDVTMFAQELYFHVLAYPEATGIDPEVFKLYWVKINMEEIAKELALSGAVMPKAGYGSFGDRSKANSFTALLSRYNPFTPGDMISDTPSDPSTLHFKLKTDPEQMYLLVSALYSKYTGTELTVDADQQVRLKGALAKVEAEVWVDATTNTLKKFSLKANLDDDIVGVHAKGPIAMEFELSNFDAPVAVSEPTPALTLPELQSRMNDFKQLQGIRALDAQKQGMLQPIQAALELYKTEVGRYPTLLSELRAKSRLATTVVSDAALKDYYYVSYVKPDLFTKANKCFTAGKVCVFYHLGVNFTDVTNPTLASDGDATTDVLGDDRAGCGNEQNVACYDLTSSPVISPASTTSP